MGKEARLLSQVPDGTTMQRQRWRKEFQVAQRDKAVVGLLDAGNGRENRALARAGSAEQPYGFSRTELQRNFHLKVATLLFDLRSKHGVDAVPTRGPARVGAGPRTERPPATASPRADRSSADSPRAAPACLTGSTPSQPPLRTRR